MRGHAGHPMESKICRPSEEKLGWVSKVRDPSTSLGMTKENAYARVQEYKYSS
jgi:hypothetical protein